MVYAVILAGGLGKRMNSETLKQFALVGDTPIVHFSVKAFCEHEKVDRAIVVAFDVEAMQKCLEPVMCDKISVVKGGESRSKSLECGMAEAIRLGATGDDLIVSHDAARPFVTKRLIDDAIALAEEYGASSAAIKMSDTLALTDGINLTGLVDRSRVAALQTPQCSKLKYMQKAFLEAGGGTDLYSLLMQAGVPVRIFDGNRDNIKITYYDDLLYANCIYKSKKDGELGR